VIEWSRTFKIRTSLLKQKKARSDIRAGFIYVNRVEVVGQKLNSSDDVNLIKSYFLLQPVSLLLESFASSSSLASSSTSFEILNEQVFVVLSPSKSVAPIPVRAARTAPTQPPQLIAGTLSVTSCNSLALSAEALSSIDDGGSFGVSGAAGSPQPTMPASRARAKHESRVRI
jgi:hypothetical protein